MFGGNLLSFLLVLLVCGNVALLMFARAATRENEILVRTALGAGRGRIMGQLFVEALVLAMVAALVAVHVLMCFGYDVVGHHRVSDREGLGKPAATTDQDSDRPGGDETGQGEQHDRRARSDVDVEAGHHASERRSRPEAHRDEDRHLEAAGDLL